MQTPWLRPRGARQFHLSGNLATMATGLPYAMAAQWAIRDASASPTSATAAWRCSWPSWTAKGFAEAFLRGEPDKLDTVKTIVQDQIDKLRG